MEMKIVKIINSKQIIVNAGSEAGLKTGDKLEIIDKFGSDPVIDPDTGENLGTLDIPKGTVYVSRLYPRMAIAETKSITPYTHANAYLPVLGRQADLNVNPTQITGGLPEPSGNPISIGDIVIKR